MNKITVALMRHLEKKVTKGEISYSRMIEILNETTDLTKPSSKELPSDEEIKTAAIVHSCKYFSGHEYISVESFEAGALFYEEKTHPSKQNLIINKLQAFKDYVHQRLDEAGIEKEPNGEHSKVGCRIGDRLDLVLQSQKPLTVEDIVGIMYKKTDSDDDNTWLNSESFYDVAQSIYSEISSNLQEEAVRFGEFIVKKGIKQLIVKNGLTVEQLFMSPEYKSFKE